MTVLLALDLVGVFFFALSGNLLAARRQFDITGGFTLGVLAGLGGGITRDVLLGEVPNALQNPIYFVPPVLAAVLVYLFGRQLDNARSSIVAFDAGGLALFVITGTTIALDAGLPVFSALLLGVTSGVGGGLIRDVVANEVPAVFDASNLYVVPAVTGAALTALADGLNILHWTVGLGIAVFVFVFRMASWWKGWSVPQQVREWTFRDLQTTGRGAMWRPRGATSPGGSAADHGDHDHEHGDDPGDDDPGADGGDDLRRLRS